MTGTEQIPVYAYTITMTDGTTRQVNAIGYQQDGEWWHFDDLNGTVRTIRHQLIDEVARGEQVGQQEAEKL